MTIVDEPDTVPGSLIPLRGIGQSRAMERVDTAISALAAGRAVIVCDDPDHPTRGDLVFAASTATTELTAFAVHHTTGFLYVALDAGRCRELYLVSQIGADSGETAQRVTVDAKYGIGTGISAADRAATARLLASNAATAESFTRPGHVVPVQAQLDLPARRYGIADCAARLTLEAGRGAAAVLGTIDGAADPTELAAGTELLEFGAVHSLPLVGVLDLATAYPQRCPLIVPMHLSSGPAQLYICEDTHDDEKLVCLVIGDVSDRSAVPLQVFPAQNLLLETTRVGDGPFILLGAMGHTPVDVLTQQARLEESLLRPNSRVREVLTETGVQSVWHRHRVQH